MPPVIVIRDVVPMCRRYGIARLLSDCRCSPRVVCRNLLLQFDPQGYGECPWRGSISGSGIPAIHDLAGICSCNPGIPSVHGLAGICSCNSGIPSTGSGFTSLFEALVIDWLRRRAFRPWRGSYG